MPRCLSSKRVSSYLHHGCWGCRNHWVMRQAVKRQQIIGVWSYCSCVVVNILVYVQGLEVQSVSGTLSQSFLTALWGKIQNANVVLFWLVLYPAAIQCLIERLVANVGIDPFMSIIGLRTFTWLLRVLAILLANKICQNSTKTFAIQVKELCRDAEFQIVSQLLVLLCVHHVQWMILSDLLAKIQHHHTLASIAVWYQFSYKLLCSAIWTFQSLP